MQQKQEPAGIASRHGAEETEWLLLAVPGLIWGASFLFIAEGMLAVGPWGLASVRIAIGFVTLSLFPSARASISRSDWTSIFWLGVLWLAFPLTMFPLAERHVSSALTGMLNGANPLFTAMVASAIERRRPSRRVMTGIGVGMVGVSLMAIPGLHAGQSSAACIGMIVAALVSYGVALNIATPLQRRNGALPVIWRAQAVALILTAPLGLREAMTAQWSLWSVLALLTLGALGTGVAHVVMSVAAGRLGATRASATAFLIPGVALVLGIVVRHEKVAMISVVGSGICLAGAWLMRRARSTEGVCGNSNRTKQRELQNAELLQCKQGG